MGHNSSTPFSVEEASHDAEAQAAALNALHFLARVWLGGLGLAWDEIRTLSQSPSTFLKRGEEVERTLVQKWYGLGEAMRAGSGRVVAGLRSPIDWAVGGVQSKGLLAEEELERQIEMALERLGIPSRERLLQLGEEIDALAQRIDAELAREIA